MRKPQTGKGFCLVLALLLVLSTIGIPVFSQVQFTVQDVFFQPGDTAQAEFRVYGFDSIAAYQFALQYDTSALSCSRIELTDPTPYPMDDLGGSFFADLGDTLFFPNCIMGNFCFCTPGEICTVWTNPFTSTCEDGNLVFILYFISKKSGNLSQVISEAPYVLPSVAYEFTFDSIAGKNKLKKLPLSVVFIDNETTSINNTDFQALSIVPNPAHGHTTLHFSTPAGGPAVLRLVDATGRQAINKTMECNAGENTMCIDLAHGAYFGALYTMGKTMPVKIISN